jgi:hypothetical protein
MQPDRWRHLESWRKSSLEDQRRRLENVPIEERLRETIAWSAALLADSLRRGEVQERPLPIGLGSLVR